MTGTTPEVRVVADGPALAEAAAEEVSRALSEAVAARGTATVALAGGSTPRELYERLAAPPWRERIPWDRLVVLWGDERCVPPDDPASNFRMADETLLSKVLVPRESVHRIRGELGPEAAAADYERRLRGILGDPPAPLDLVLLGIGADGHTASLFPPAVGLEAERRLAVPARAPEPPRERVSLALPVINAAQRILVLARGAGKADAIARALGDPPDETLPAAHLRHASGRVLWLLDRGASAGLER